MDLGISEILLITEGR